MNATATQIADADRVSVLKLLVAGRDFGFVRAANMHLSDEDIRQIAQSHGYPDKAKMEWAVDEILKHSDAAARGSIPATQAPAPTPTRPRPAQPEPDPPAARQRPAFDATADLLLRAASHPRARVQALGKKVSDQLIQLRDALAQADAEEKAKRAAADRRAAEKRSRERAKQQMRDEVNRLEAELRSARDKLRGGKTRPKTSSTTDRSESAKIRAWCRDNDVEVGTQGRIPTHVRAKYDAAHPQAQAS